MELRIRTATSDDVRASLTGAKNSVDMPLEKTRFAINGYDGSTKEAKAMASLRRGIVKTAWIQRIIQKGDSIQNVHTRFFLGSYKEPRPRYYLFLDWKGNFGRVNNATIVEACLCRYGKFKAIVDDFSMGAPITVASFLREHSMGNRDAQMFSPVPHRSISNEQLTEIFRLAFCKADKALRGIYDAAEEAMHPSIAEELAARGFENTMVGNYLAPWNQYGGPLRPDLSF